MKNESKPSRAGCAGRNVERIEIVVLGLDLGSDHHRKTAALKVGGCIAKHGANRMNAAGRRWNRWKRDVDRLRKLIIERTILETRLRDAEFSFHALDRFVDDFARVGPLRRRKLSDAAPQRRYFAAASEKCDPHVLERALVGSECNRRFEAAVKIVKLGG